MPDDDVQSIYDELNKRGVFKIDTDAQAIGHELRARGVVSDATQGGLVKPTPSQASSSIPANANQSQLQNKWNTLMAKSKPSTAPITTQTMPSSGKSFIPNSRPPASPQANAAFQKQYADAAAGNAFYTKSQLDALPNDFTGWLKRTLSGMVTPENMLIGGAVAAAPALGPLGVAAERTAGYYFGAQGVAQGIKVGQKYGLGAGLGAAVPFIAPAALGKAGEMVSGKGLPAPEAQPAAPVQPGRPIVPTEPGTSRPPFIGTPTPLKEVAAPDATRMEPSSSTSPVPSVPTSVDDSVSRLRANNSGFKAGGKPETAAAELMSAGKLSYSPDKSQWALGPYTGKTAKYVVDAYAKNGGDIRPIADRLAAHAKDVENLKAQYAQTGQPIPETGALSRLTALQAERDSLYQPQPTPEATATAKAPDTTAPPQVPPVSPQQVAGSPAQPAGEPLPPESAAAIERIKAGLAAKQTPAPVETAPTVKESLTVQPPEVLPSKPPEVAAAPVRPMIDQGILSPSGKTSKRGLAAAQQRNAAELFPPGYWDEINKLPPTDRVVQLRKQAANLRDLAARGMSPRAFPKQATQLEAQADAIEALRTPQSSEVTPAPVKPTGLPKPTKSNPIETVKQGLPPSKIVEGYTHVNGKPLPVNSRGLTKPQVEFVTNAVAKIKDGLPNEPSIKVIPDGTRWQIVNEDTGQKIIGGYSSKSSAELNIPKHEAEAFGVASQKYPPAQIIDVPGDGTYRVQTKQQAERLAAGIKSNSNLLSEQSNRGLGGHVIAAEGSSAFEAKGRGVTLAEMVTKTEGVEPPEWAKGKLSSVEQAAQDRIAARKTEGKSSLGSTGGKAASDAIENLQDFAIIGAARIARGAVNFADWSKDFVSHVATHLGDAYAESIKPHLQAIYEAAKSKHEESTKNSKPVGTGAETAAETKTATPEEPARTTGIAQRVHDARNPGGIQPGEGASPEQILGYGRKWIKDGGDPEAHMKMMESRGKSAEGADIGIVRAQHEILSKATDRASDASRAKPLDKNLKDAYNTAKQAETGWAKRIKPFQTEWSKAGSGMQGETATDTGSFSSIRRAFEKTANRTMTPQEETQAAAHADKVKGLETQVSDLQSKLDAAMKQTADTKTVRNQTNAAGKVKLPTDAAELRKAFAEMRSKGTLYANGNIKSPTPGAKTGAVNFGKGQFTPEVARAIWSHAKENYIDKGVDFDTTVNGVASDLGLSHDEVKGAFSQNKYVKDVTDDMYRKMSARRDAVNQAKRFIETSNQSKAAKTWNTVTNLPRGIAVFGHGSVGMVTHAGPNMFRPSSWSTYWPNVINQFKYWDPLHPINGGITHEQAMLRIEKDPNYTMWDRNGLKINPNKAFDDYEKYGKFIGAIGRSGNRGMDALKSFRLEYANKIWEGLPDNLKKEPDMQKLVADWVNHASGVGSLGHGQMAKVVNEGMFAGSLEASRWARVLGDPVKTAKTYGQWVASKAGQAPPPPPAELAMAHFRVKRAAELTAVMAGALAANNGLLVATNQKDRINMLHPTQSDWLKFKWGGKTFDTTGNMAGPIRFLAQLLAEANPNRTPAAWEHGENRSELMTQTTGQYIRGKLAPQYGIAADIATGANAIGRPLPWSKERGKPTSPKYTPIEYGMEHAPLPFAGAAEAVYEAMREKGASDAEARGWIDKLKIYGGTFAKTLGTEMTGVRVGKPSKPFRPASTGSGVSYKPIKF